jgi:hypothetical protein
MKPNLWGALGVAFCLAAAPTRVARADKKINITTGLWEMTGRMTMMGNEMAIPVVQQCLTEKDLVPMGDQAGMKCKTTQKVSASTVNWTTTCAVDGGGSMKGVGKVTYTGKEFTGSMTMTMTHPKMGEQKGSMTMEGKYVGPCTKKK